LVGIDGTEMLDLKVAAKAAMPAGFPPLPEEDPLP